MPKSESPKSSAPQAVAASGVNTAPSTTSANQQHPKAPDSKEESKDSLKMKILKAAGVGVALIVVGGLALGALVLTGGLALPAAIGSVGATLIIAALESSKSSNKDNRDGKGDIQSLSKESAKSISLQNEQNLAGQNNPTAQASHQPVRRGSTSEDPAVTQDSVVSGEKGSRSMAEAAKDVRKAGLAGILSRIEDRNSQSFPTSGAALPNTKNTQENQGR
jgi:hypothetical protein